MNKVLTFICIVALLCAVVGCGGQETKSDAQPTQPQVDPRYATAEALLDYFNELNTASPPRHAEIRREFRAETPEQQRLLDWSDFLLSFIEFDIAMYQHIDDYTTKLPIDDLLAPSEPARITEWLDRRVIATYRDSTGAEQQLHLVKLDGRWWSSGYTFEYSRVFSEFELALLDAGERIGMSAHERNRRTRVNRRSAERVRRGEFSTMQELTDAGEAGRFSGPQ